MLNRKVTSKKLIIHGTSTINHQIRKSMGLHCSEYVLMDFIARRGNNEGFDSGAIYRNTGFNEQEIQKLLTTLVIKGFISTAKGKFEITDRWEKSFPKFDTEFEEFWIVNGKAVWTGSKTKARTFYEEVRKKYTKETLFFNRDQYLRYLKLENDRGFDRRIMAADRYLNPKNDYHILDWKTQADNIDPNKQKKEKPKALTMADIERAYAKTNN